MFVFLSTTALVLGFITLYSSSVPKLPIWLRIASIVIGLGFAGLGIWSIFMVGDSVKVAFPTLLYILPVLAILASSLYQWNIISWGLNYADKPVRIAKVRKPKKPKTVKTKTVKVKKEKTSKEELKVAETTPAPILESPVAKPTNTLPPRTPNTTPAKPVSTAPKTVTTSDGFDLKLPDLF